MSTGISWTDKTWNPTTGCSRVSAGCEHCYAAKLAPRLAAMGQTDAYTDLPWTKPNAEQNVRLHPDRLEMPLRWKKPRRIFVDSMSDLFHELVPFEFVDKVFAVMALSPRHTFQVLTKRPERMAEYLRAPERYDRVMAVLFAGLVWDLPDRTVLRVWRDAPREDVWPLPNVWLGTSIENADALWRADWLRRTPAAVRFVSAEPLLGPLVRSQERCPKTRAGDGRRCVRPVGHPADCAAEWGSTTANFGEWPPELDLEGIDWVIAGGESGPGHRTMQEDWARSLRDQCVAAGVPFFFKQHSGPRNEMDPLLDDREWREMPATAGAVAS